jgi:hypothetical protein
MAVEEVEPVVTVIRVAEASSWVEVRKDDQTELTMANGGFAFEHAPTEVIHSIDYSRVPNVRPREVPIGPGKNAPRINIALCVMRVLFVDQPQTIEDAGLEEKMVHVDPEQVKAGKKLVLPGD